MPFKYFTSTSYSLVVKMMCTHHCWAQEASSSDDWSRFKPFTREEKKTRDGKRGEASKPGASHGMVHTWSERMSIAAPPQSHPLGMHIVTSHHTTLSLPSTMPMCNRTHLAHTSSHHITSHHAQLTEYHANVQSHPLGTHIVTSHHITPRSAYRVPWRPGMAGRLLG